MHLFFLQGSLCKMAEEISYWRPSSCVSRSWEFVIGAGRELRPRSLPRERRISPAAVTGWRSALSLTACFPVSAPSVCTLLPADVLATRRQILSRLCFACFAGRLNSRIIRGNFRVFCPPLVSSLDAPARVMRLISNLLHASVDWRHLAGKQPICFVYKSVVVPIKDWGGLYNNKKQRTRSEMETNQSIAVCWAVGRLTLSKASNRLAHARVRREKSAGFYFRAQCFLRGPWR
jgi:hypothetical protein